MLSDRRQRVLAALIEEYVLHALPVGSRTLVENYRLGVSSATVRNELSVLEDDGYITQPHTSAGRVPTDFGYRSFVDDLLAGEMSGAEEDARTADAARRMRQSAAELDDLLERTTAALARFTECLSIVVPPSTLTLHIRQVTFVSLSARRVLVVVVTEDGQVMNRHVECAFDVDSGDLARAQQVANDVLAGKSLAEARQTLSREEAEALRDPLMGMMLGEVLACLKEGEGGHAHRLGLPTLLRQPEFRDSAALMPVLEVLEDDTVLLQLLQGQGESGTTVRIGRENGTEQLSGVSVVASPYGRGESMGVVAVIGPTRMNYAQVIRAVRAACATLGDE